MKKKKKTTTTKQKIKSAKIKRKTEKVIELDKVEVYKTAETKKKKKKFELYIQGV